MGFGVAYDRKNRKTEKSIFRPVGSARMRALAPVALALGACALPWFSPPRHDA